MFKKFTRYLAECSKLSLVTLVMATQAMAGLPPTTIKGQSDTSASPKFNFQVPARQATNTGGVNVLIETGNKNLLADPGFEGTTITTKWTASGGTLASESTAANVGSGSKSGSWDASASSQTLLSEAQTIPAGLYARNGVASCLVKTAATDLKIQAYDGTNVLAEQTVVSGSNFVNQIVPFIFPSSGNIQIRFISASNSAVAYIDDCFLGEMPSILVNQITNWQSYTLTIAGSTSNPTTGTIVRNTAYWRRVGSDMEILYDFEQSSAGTAGSGDYLFPIPSGYTIDTSKMSISTTLYSNVVGPASASVNGGGEKGGYVKAYNSTNLSIVAWNHTDAPNRVGSGYNALSNTSTVFSFRAAFPVLGWTSQQVIPIENSGIVWHGTHGSDCSFADTDTSFDDVETPDASCTFTSTSGDGYGTLSPYLSGSDDLPGVTFTPLFTGMHEACADFQIRNNTTGHYTTAQLVNPSGTAIGEAVVKYESSGSDGLETKHVCGLFTVTSITSQTIKLQIKVSSGTGTISNVDGSGAAINWTIKPISRSFPAPYILNSVSSPYSGQIVVAAARIAGASDSSVCSSSPCTTYRETGDWISSVTRTGTGRYTVNFQSGIFPQKPTCTFGPSYDHLFTYTGSGDCTTTSCVIGTDTNTNTAQDSLFDMICVGVK